MSRINLSALVLGCESPLGSALVRALRGRVDVHAVSGLSLDLCDPAILAGVLREIQPAVVFNALREVTIEYAGTKPEKVYIRYVVVPGIIAEETKRLNGLLIHYSSYHVFNGQKSTPYMEEDTPSPLNAYGQAHLDGERRIHEIGCRFLTFRLGWTYSTETLPEILRDGRGCKSPRQHGSPCWTESVALASADTLQTIQCMGLPNQESGIYHMAGGGEVTWGGFLRAVRANAPEWFSLLPSEEQVSRSSATVALTNSILNPGKLFRAFGVRLPHWKKQLNSALHARSKITVKSQLGTQRNASTIAV